MTLQVSTGFKKRIIGPSSFEDIFNGGAIAVYSGAQPATADLAATGTLLGYFTDAGGTWTPGSATNGLTWYRADAYAVKPVGQAWSVSPVANGTASWFRILTTSGDVAATSYTVPRIDGAISATGVSVEMRLVNPVLTIGTLVSLEQFWYTILPLPGA